MQFTVTARPVTRQSGKCAARKASFAAGRDFPQRRRIRRKRALPLQSAVTALPVKRQSFKCAAGKPALPQAEISPQRRRIRRKQALQMQFTVTAPSREKANRENPQIFPIRK